MDFEQQMRTEHSRFAECCRSCHLGFNYSHLYAQHTSSLHSLRVFGEDFEPRDRPTTETAFNGLLRTFERTDAYKARDLETFMRAQKSRIDNLINEQLCRGPQKAQFCAKLHLIKYHNDQPDNAEDECFKIYANSVMTPVYANGLTIAAYWGMVEKTIGVSTPFDSMGSGWVLEKCRELMKKFARFRPVRGSSYIALSTKVANCGDLLNIINHEDQPCFRYCYVAAYPLHHKINLDKIDQNYQTHKTSPTTYNQPGIHQPLGKFDMPMGFDDIPELTKLNEVQVNVYGYHNRQLFPLKILSYESEFVMELFLLYDYDHLHNVLITHLLKVICYLQRIDFCYCYQICRNCFWICEDGLESYNVHMTKCDNNAAAVIHMPSSDQNSCKFTNLSATWFVPLVKYFDSEIFLRSVSGYRWPSSRILTHVKEIHEAFGFAQTVIDHHSIEPISLTIWPFWGLYS